MTAFEVRVRLEKWVHPAPRVLRRPKTRARCDKQVARVPPSSALYNLGLRTLKPN